MLSIMTIVVGAWGCIGALSGLFQTKEIIKNKTSNGVSLYFMGMYCFGFLLWLIYGVMISNIPLIITDLVGLIVSIITIITILKYKENTKTNKIPDKEFSKSFPADNYHGKDSFTPKIRHNVIFFTK